MRPPSSSASRSSWSSPFTSSTSGAPHYASGLPSPNSYLTPVPRVYRSPASRPTWRVAVLLEAISGACQLGRAPTRLCVHSRTSGSARRSAVGRIVTWGLGHRPILDRAATRVLGLRFLARVALWVLGPLFQGRAAIRGRKRHRARTFRSKGSYRRVLIFGYS